MGRSYLYEKLEGKRMKTKKLISVLLVSALTAAMASGCGSSSESGSTAADTKTAESASEESTQAGGSSQESDLAGTSITFLNSKGEIQEAMEELAAEFTDETGIDVEILACGTGESPYTKVTSAYNSGSAPTMSMLDTTDALALADEYALDLSNEDWVKECENTLTYSDGKVFCFPFCIEGRGLIVNKKAVEDTLGETFDPDSIQSYDDLKALLEQLKAAGMETPVVVSKEDWSLGNHQLGYIYDTYDGTTEGSAEVISQLEDGTLKTADYDRYNEFIQTLDLLLEYNINGEDPLGAMYDQDPIYLVDGDAAIWPNGTWAWPNLAEAGAETSDDYCFIPYVLGNDTSAAANTGMQASATKQVIIDKVQATEEQQAAAKEFLNWMVYNETAQKMLVEDVAIVPANSNNTVEPLDPLGKDMKSKMNEGKTYSSCFVAPSDHWQVLGASMQKYIAGESTKDELAADVDTYWQSQK